MGLFDVHAHLTHPRLAEDADALVARAEAAGVTTILSNGLHPADNARVAALAARHEVVRPCFGLYPVDAVLHEMTAQGVDYARDDTDELPDADTAVAWVRDHVDDCVAVGEIGLDHHWVPESLWDRQEEVFRALVQVAMDADKPIIIHSRKAEARTFAVLEDMGCTRVNWHCYSSKVKLAKRIAAHGHWMSIPANARRQSGFTRMLEVLPRDKVLLETDCPYLGPVPGETNEPANVATTWAYAAELWEEPAEAVLRQLEGNFEALFGFAP